MTSAAISEEAAAAYWADFSTAQSPEQFYTSWLGILCTQIEHVTGGLLLIASDQANTFALGAVWPDSSRDMTHLGPTAQQALTERRGVVIPHPGSLTAGVAGGAFVAYPVEVGGVLRGAVVLDTAARPQAELQQVLRLVHWAIAWLVDLFRQQLGQERERAADRMALANAVVVAALQNRRFKPCVLAVTNELALRFGCDRVSLGWDRNGSAVIEAISNTAAFDRKANLSRAIADAMDEALDLGLPVVYPAQGDDRLISAAQAALAAQAKALAVLSVLLVSNGRNLGVLTFERTGGEVFDALGVETCKTLGMLLGPILDLKRDNERGAWRRAWDAWRDGVRALFGPRHSGVKLIALVVAAVVLFLSLASGEYRVAAKTVVEGSVQRAAAAPFEGYIAASFVRAGDLVKKGQVLAQLDDRDLKLEQAKWDAEREQYLRKYRQAQANHERSAMNVLGAQASQAEAQAMLAQDKLSRAQLIAPFDGVVVTGDLHQLLGTPVEQGKVLFEIAPLDSYRVILKVDERDVAYLALGQTGALALSGMPGERLNFTVKQITPVSTAEDGRNFFRVEAQMEGGVQRLRPGMEGIGKVSVGERKWIWIWTHSLVDWARISLWTWLP